jgi:tetratricopeptide (TPR) repeat protein
MDENEAAGSKMLDHLLDEFPLDARLHFLHGSLAAAGQDYASARIAMRRAVDLAPDFAIARFQLGFLLLTSGEPHAAQEAWGPLHLLPPDHHLRIFVLGLCRLIADEFDEAIGLLLDGIGRNSENPALNGDMQLIVEETRRKSVEQVEGEPLSHTHLLLQQSAFKSTKH